MTITLDQAKGIIAGAFAYASRTSLKPLAVAVLDAGGHLVAYERQDGSSNLRFHIAFGKANGALGMGRGGRTLAAMAQNSPHFVAAVTVAAGGAFIPVPGGILINDPEGGFLGAIGVSGDTADNDELAGVAGATEAGLTTTVD